MGISLSLKNKYFTLGKHFLTTNSENYSNKILYFISTFGIDTIKFVLAFDYPMTYELLCYKQLIFFVLGMMKVKHWGYTRLCSTKYTFPCVQARTSQHLDETLQLILFYEISPGDHIILSLLVSSSATQTLAFFDKLQTTELLRAQNWA